MKTITYRFMQCSNNEDVPLFGIITSLSVNSGPDWMAVVCVCVWMRARSRSYAVYVAIVKESCHRFGAAYTKSGDKRLLTGISHMGNEMWLKFNRPFDRVEWIWCAAWQATTWKSRECARIRSRSPLSHNTHSVVRIHTPIIILYTKTKIPRREVVIVSDLHMVCVSVVLPPAAMLSSLFGSLSASHSFTLALNRIHKIFICQFGWPIL